MYAPPEVAVFVVRDQDGYVLLLHRVPADGGYWHIVAGRIDDGEIPEEAAARELREETGLVADVVFVGRGNRVRISRDADARWTRRWDCRSRHVFCGQRSAIVGADFQRGA
jgi:8-oxo-dGTP pyrophosphatase MutT (NUDIX family)